jgi:hypothetical protein
MSVNATRLILTHFRKPPNKIAVGDTREATPELCLIFSFWGITDINFLCFYPVSGIISYISLIFAIS